MLARSTFATPNERLAAFFNTTQPRASFADPEIDEITVLLEQCGHFAHRCPRTYILLRSINKLDILERMVSEGFSDQWFPVQHSSLPTFVEPSTKETIVEHQEIILTKSLDLENGRHRHFAPDEVLPFEILGRLGSGGYSQVDKIISKISSHQYALKRIRRRAAFGNNSKDTIKMFLNEMKIVKALQHRHFVQYIGSYTDKNFLGLIISPVAELDLAAYMQRLCESTQALQTRNTPLRSPSYGQPTATEMCVNMRTYFGCLASALTYLHSQSIRHKDIKPQNILVAKGNILFSDFGLSRNFADDSGSTTSGMTPMSPRYSAPEVAAYQARNTSSDVWSLGCVFLEMAAAMQGLDVDWIRDHFSNNNSRAPHFHINPQVTERLIQTWQVSWKQKDRQPLVWIRSMLKVNPQERPTAARVLEMITNNESDVFSSNMFCGICCMPDQDMDSADSLEDEFCTLTDYSQTSESKTIKPLALRPNMLSNPDAGDIDANDAMPKSPVLIQPRVIDKPRIQGRSQQSMPTPKPHLSYISKEKSLQNVQKPSLKVFGKPLSVSIGYASVDVSHFETNVHLQGRIPIVIAKCGSFLREKVTNDGLVDEDLLVACLTMGSESRLFDTTLQARFDAHSDYGLNYDWSKHDHVDAGKLLFLFLASLPEPTIPRRISTKIRQAWLHGATENATIEAIQSLLAKIPSPNREVLLYMIDLFAMCDRSPFDRDKRVNAVAAKYHRCFLSLDTESDSQEDRLDYEISILRYFINHASRFLDPAKNQEVPKSVVPEPSTPEAHQLEPMKTPPGTDQSHFDTSELVSRELAIDLANVGLIEPWVEQTRKHNPYQPAPHNRKNEVFGVPLFDSLQYASTTRNLHQDLRSAINKEVKIPIIVAECCSFLIKKSRLYRNCFETPDERDQEQVGILISIFDQYPNFGQDHDWTGFNAYHAGATLLLYLSSLGDAIIPAHIGRKLPHRNNYDPDSILPSYIAVLLELPQSHQDLLIYLLAFFTSFEATFTEGSRFTELAKIFAPVLVRVDSEPQSMYPFHLTSFLMVNAMNVISKMAGRPSNTQAAHEYVVARYSFKSDVLGDLSFKAGDRIRLIKRTDDTDAWWEGELDGKTGIFPANYCSPIL